MRGRDCYHHVPGCRLATYLVLLSEQDYIALAIVPSCTSCFEVLKCRKVELKWLWQDHFLDVKE